MSKSDQLDRIKKGDVKIKRMLREGKKGPDLDQLLNDVIKWEFLYLKRYNRDPNKDVGD